MENEIITVEPQKEIKRSFVLENRTPSDQVTQATAIAGYLKDIIVKQKMISILKTKHGPKEHVNFEGWLTLATFMGALPREIETTEQDGVFHSTYALVSFSTGQELTRASGTCGANDEFDKYGNPVWANRPSYAKKSMAQTRAAAKCCRIAFSWIMQIAGYEPTPTEEMLLPTRKEKEPEPPPPISFNEYEFVINTIKQYHLDEKRITAWVKKRWQVDNISELTSAQALALLVKIPEFAAQVADQNEPGQDSRSE